VIDYLIFLLIFQIKKAIFEIENYNITHNMTAYYFDASL